MLQQHSMFQTHLLDDVGQSTAVWGTRSPAPAEARCQTHLLGQASPRAGAVSDLKLGQASIRIRAGETASFS